MKKKMKHFWITDKKSKANWGGLEAGGMSLKMLFHFKLSMGKFRCNDLELFFSNRWTRGGRKNFKLQNRPIFQDQSDSPSSSLEFYKSCKLELASKFIPREIICGRSLAEFKICLKTEKILARWRKQPNFRTNNRTPSRDLKTKRRVGPWPPKAEKNGLSFKSPKRETEPKRLKVLRKKD
jgi:hypothetical protein